MPRRMQVDWLLWGIRYINNLPDWAFHWPPLSRIWVLPEIAALNIHVYITESDVRRAPPPFGERTFENTYVSTHKCPMVVSCRRIFPSSQKKQAAWDYRLLVISGEPGGSQPALTASAPAV